MKNCMREITIREVLNGFVVTVGCQTVVFNAISDLVDTLKAYALDPKKVEADYGFKDEPVPAEQPISANLSQATATYWAPSPYDLSQTSARGIR